MWEQMQPQTYPLYILHRLNAFLELTAIEGMRINFQKSWQAYTNRCKMRCSRQQRRGLLSWSIKVSTKIFRELCKLAVPSVLIHAKSGIYDKSPALDLSVFGTHLRNKLDVMWATVRGIRATIFIGIHKTHVVGRKRHHLKPPVRVAFVVYACDSWSCLEFALKREVLYPWS